jgi:hypothetical protein
VFKDKYIALLEDGCQLADTLIDSNFPHPKGVMHLENSILQTIKKA